MFGRLTKIIVMMLIGLAILGFGFTLITNPLALLKQALIILLIIGGFYLLYKLFLTKRRGSKDFSLYQKAAKQSARRYKQNQVHQPKKKKPQPLMKKAKNQKREHNFTVIEGKKGKKNNRAL